MVKMEIFTIPADRACKATINMVKRIQKSREDIEVEEIDIFGDDSRVNEYRIPGAPTIAINGEVRFIGTPKEKDLIKAL